MRKLTFAESCLIFISMLMPGSLLLGICLALPHWLDAMWIRQNFGIYLAIILSLTSLVMVPCCFFAAGILASRVPEHSRRRAILRCVLGLVSIQIILVPATAILASALLDRF